MSRGWEAVLSDFQTWLGLLGFAPEVPFRGLSGKRQWRFDFAHPTAMVAVEYQGKGVGHMSVSGTFRDP